MHGGRAQSCLNLMDQALLTPHGTPCTVEGVDGGGGEQRWEERGGSRRDGRENCARNVK